jgi:hypothetical protein
VSKTNEKLDEPKTIGYATPQEIALLIANLP